MRVLDLFSGIGGFSLGLEKAGHETVALCEIEEYPRRVLAERWPGVPLLGDVTKETFEGIDAELIVGGFPCQDLSHAGQGAGLAGARSGLYRELVRAIRVVRPKHAIVENVAALLGRGMGTVLGDMAESGFDAEWDCVPACAIGARHERDRVWIVAHAQSERCGQGREGRPVDCFAGLRNTSCGDAADTERLQGRERCEPDEERRRQEETEQTGMGAGRTGAPWAWPDEPALLGVDDGVPHRVDRVRALGNAVVPQIPELIGRAILRVEYGFAQGL